MSIGSRKARVRARFIGLFGLLVFSLIAAFGGGPQFHAQAQSDTLDDDLSGYWRFDEGRGKVAYDETPFANDGRLVGEPDWVLGLIEFGLDFYARRGFSVQVADHRTLDAREELTLACWVCLRQRLVEESEDDAFSLFAKPFQEAYGLGIARDEGVLFGTVGLDDGRARRLQGRTAVPYDRWVHVAFSYDARTGEARLYLDGELDAAGRIGPGPLKTNAAPLLLGAALDPDPAAGPEETFRVLPGILDEARLYRRVLSGEEILRLAKEAALAPQQPCGQCYAPPAVVALLEEWAREPVITQEVFLRWLLLLLNTADAIPMTAPIDEIVQYFFTTGVIPDAFPVDLNAPITKGEAALLLLRALEIETPLLDQLLLSAGLQAAEEAALEIAVREGLVPPGEPDDVLTGLDLNLMSDWLLQRLETAPPAFFEAKDVACAQAKRLFRRQGPTPPPPPEPPSS